MKTYLKQLFDYEKNFAPRDKKSHKKIVLTVSGQAGTGKTTVADILAKNFHLKIYNVGDKQRSFATRKKISLSKASEIIPSSLDLSADRQTLSLAIKGGYVLVGRLAGWAAGDFADCRILVTCPQILRAKRLTKRENVSFGHALKMVKMRDQADRLRYLRLYGIDFLKKNIYNVIINNRYSSIKEFESAVLDQVKKYFKN